MPKFTFVVEAAISLSTEVEADTLKEAVKEAQERGVMTLCNQCAKGESDAWNTAGEIDAEPSMCNLAEVYDENDNEISEEAKKYWG